MKTEQFISVLQKQIDQLDHSEFDIEAWKKGTVTRLLNIYPVDDPKILQIQELKIDYSSWALRDSNSSYKPVETCKKMGKAILEAIIDELNIFGFPKSASDKSDFSIIYSMINEEKVDQFKELSKNPSTSSFKKHLQAYDKKKLVEIIQGLMS